MGKDWRNEEGEREKGGKYGKQVEAMLEVYLEGSQPLDRVEKIQEEGIEQVCWIRLKATAIIILHFNRPGGWRVKRK